MDLCITICFYAALALIGYQDFKDRKVSLLFFVLLFAASSLIAVVRQPWAVVLTNFSVTVMILAFVVFFLFLYTRIRFGYFFNPLNNLLGIGDVLFWIAFAPLFSPLEYFTLMTLSLIVCLFIHLIDRRLKSIKGQPIREIPLAGMQAVLLLGLFTFNEYIIKKDILLVLITRIINQET